MYSQLALQEIDDLVNKISKAKKQITPDVINNSFLIHLPK